MVCLRNYPLAMDRSHFSKIVKPVSSNCDVYRYQLFGVNSKSCVKDKKGA